MLLSSLLFIPILGIFLISSNMSYEDTELKIRSYKITALVTSILNLVISLVIFLLFDFSSNQFQFVQEHYDLNLFDIYLGVDGLSIYFVLLTTIIMPIAILSNWNSITENVKSYLIIMLLLETLLLAVFLVLDILLFYIFFESILPPLFLLLGLFGSSNKVRASFYLFLYTLKNYLFQCKRAKLRGSPKALVTKVVEETLQPAWLMLQGKVTSLVFITPLWKPCFAGRWESVSLLKWVITYLNQIIPVTRESVKEQRVDGSSDSRTLVSVRCTLVAGKPVFARKIPFHSHNRRVVMGLFSVAQKAFIHSTRPIQKNLTLEYTEQVNNTSISVKSTAINKLDPNFITGFVDAEGCFILGVFADSNYKIGYKVQAIFKINLDNKDYDLLCQIKDYFGAGSITKHGNTTLQYAIKSLKDLNILISHFDKYPLISQKWADYQLFKSAVLLLKNKEHLTREGFNKVLSIRASMNLGLSDELKLTFPNVTPISRPLLLDRSVKDPNWLAGFTNGEGCFFISIRKSSSCKIGKAVTLKFQIAQHSRDTELMRNIITILGCGRIELNLSRSVVYFVVMKFEDITLKVIPFFGKYPIKGAKISDYHSFKKAAILMNKKAHLTEQGLSEIQSIKSNMNFVRKTSSEK